MPLYELFCIASHNKEGLKDTAQLIQNIATRVIRNGGVVRDIRDMGVRTLPEKMRRHQINHEMGDHFTLLFDTSPPVLANLNETLKVDPGVIRWTITRKGTTIKELIPKGEFTMAFIPGPVEQLSRHQK